MLLCGNLYLKSTSCNSHGLGTKNEMLICRNLTRNTCSCDTLNYCSHIRDISFAEISQKIIEIIEKRVEISSHLKAGKERMRGKIYPQAPTRPSCF